MESTESLNFSRNPLQKSMAFHKPPQISLLLYLLLTAVETLKSPSEYSVDFCPRTPVVFHGMSRDGRSCESLVKLSIRS